MKDLAHNKGLHQPERKKKVLLVDDQVEFLVPLNLILSNLGIDATMVFDGFAARRALQEQRFDLVIIDWKMPELDGDKCLIFADNSIFLDGVHRSPMPYVTYSGLADENIMVPDLLFFYRVAHWQKPITISSLTQNLTGVFGRI